MSVKVRYDPDVHGRINKVRMTDLAEAAGCSVATVSRALQHSPLISRATRTRILQIARTRGYQDDGADALPSAQPRLAIMVGAPSSQELPYALDSLVGGLIKASLHTPCNLQVFHLPPAPGGNLEAILSDVDADGYLFFGPGALYEALSRPFEKGVGKPGARLMVWGETGQGPDSIGPDNFALGAISVAHLAGLGCGRIAYLGETQGADMSRRFMGYLTALNEAGLKFDSTLILSTLDEAMRAADGFDGLFVAGEHLYLSALERLRRISPATRVVGYYNEDTVFPMETVAIDPVEAARRILDRLFGARPKTDAAFERLPVRLRAAVAA